MAITGGWTPLSGPKVHAEATHPNRMTWAFPTLPAPPIPFTSDDGFMRDECCAPLRSLQEITFTFQDLKNVYV